MKKMNGFTLIEVLIALTILAIGLTAIVLAVQTGIKDTNHIYDKWCAHWVAMNVLSRLQVGLSVDSTHEDTHEVHMLQRQFTWEQTIGADDTDGAEESTQSNNGYYKRVTITVKRKGSPAVLEQLVGFISNGHAS